MNHIKKHPCIVMAVVGIFLLSTVAATTFYLTSEYVNVGPNEKIYYGTRNHLPTLNSNPQYYLTVVVTGDADLLKRLQPYFLVQYYAANMKCMEPVPGTFGTVKSDSIIDVVQSAKNQQKPPYVFVFTLDRYQSGICDWRPLAFSHSFGKERILQNASNITLFSNNKILSVSRSVNVKMTCNQLFSCKKVETIPFDSDDMKAPIGNYFYNVSIQPIKER